MTCGGRRQSRNEKVVGGVERGEIGIWSRGPLENGEFFSFHIQLSGREKQSCKQYIENGGRVLVSYVDQGERNGRSLTERTKHSGQSLLAPEFLQRKENPWGKGNGQPGI